MEQISKKKKIFHSSKESTLCAVKCTTFTASYSSLQTSLESGIQPIATQRTTQHSVKIGAYQISINLEDTIIALLFLHLRSFTRTEKLFKIDL